MDLLDTKRRELDKIDNELIKLIEERMNIVKEVGRYKKENNIKIYDSSREQEIIEKNIGLLNDKELAKYIEVFTKDVMKISKMLQEDLIK